MNGGYDVGYKSCRCFWGTEPGSLVRWLIDHLGRVDGLDVLDVGCGEGKNAAYFAARGARVRAIDISDEALRNVRTNWSEYAKIEWMTGDIRTVTIGESAFDIIIAYGLLHCLPSMPEILTAISRLKAATRVGGYNIICAFNSRHQDLSAHPEFHPTLVPHSEYLSQYSDWEIVLASDEDLNEAHPHNKIPHTHSMTRVIARKGF